VRVAVLIQCHRYTSALEYTIAKLSQSPFLKIYIHVDAKADASFLKPFLSESICMIKERHDVRWGNISQFHATLALIKAAAEDGFDYASLISGDDVFVRPVTEFLLFLDRMRGVEFFGIDEGFSNFHSRVGVNYPKFAYNKNKGFLERGLFKFFLMLSRFGFFKNKKVSVLGKLYKGSCWFTLSYGCLLDILSYIERNPEYLSVYENSFCADEVVLPSLLYKLGYFSRRYYPSQVFDDNQASLRYVDWGGPEFPKVLNFEDFPKIRESGCFYARKISSQISVQDLKIYFNEE
jgi:hypothetical protein